MKTLVMAISTFIVVFFVWLVLSLLFLRHVDTGQTGIVITYGGTSITSATAVDIPSNSYVWLNPFGGQSFVEYPTSQQSLTMVQNATEGDYKGDDSVACQDMGGIQVKRDITINWQVSDAKRLYLLRKISTLSGDPGNDVSSLVVRQATKSAVQTACSQFTWDQMSAKTQQIGQIISNVLQPELANSGIIVNAVYPGEVHYNQQQENALNANAVAQQQSLQAQYLQQKAQYEANAAITQAQGQARAIQILNQALSNNPNYLKYLQIQKWDGKLPYYNGSGQPIFSVGGQ